MRRHCPLVSHAPLSIIMFAHQLADVPGTNDGATGIQMQRNCSASPQLLAGVLGAMALVSLAYGLVFLSMGTPWILVYAVHLSLCLAAVFFHYAKHATDRETIVLTQHTLAITQELGGRLTQSTLPRAHIQLSLDTKRRDGIAISNGLQTVQLGSLLSPAARAELFAVLRQHLRTSPPRLCTSHLHSVLSVHSVCRLTVV